MAGNFEAEYQNVRGLSIGGVKLLHDLRTNMEDHITKINKSKTLYEISSNEKAFKEMQGQVTGGQKTLAGTNKYLTTDFIPAMRALQETLAKYSQILQDRLKKEVVNYKVTDAKVKGASVSELGVFKSQAECQKQLTELAKDIKVLEQQVAECDQSLRDLTQLVNEAMENAKRLEEDLKKAQEEADRKKREEDEKRRKEEKEEEERLRLEEEERKKREEEERLRKEAEELAKLTEEERRLKKEEEERLKREEEERLRREEEERLKREEEERLRREEEERLRLEEEERLRKEEEERLRLEEEERLRREEEERLEQERLKREEEERLRREEEERLRLEEEERLRREEEERRRKDPRYWENVIVYELRDEDVVGYGLACIIRAPEDVALKQEDVACVMIDMTSNRYPLAEHDELVSSMIHLKPTNGAELTFENDIWLALPYPQGQRSREIKMRLQKPPKDDNTNDNPWEDIETQETTIQGQEPTTKFVQTRLRHLPAEGINLTVVMRLKRDSQQLNNKGGKIISSVDHRISVQVPRNAFRLTVEITLQVIPVDSSALSELKSRYDGCENILGSSPIVILGCSHSPQQPLIFSITNPFGGKHKRPAIEATETKSGEKNRKESNLPRLSNVSGSEGSEASEAENVVLLTKEANGKWRLRQEIVLDFQKDSTVFQLQELVERFLLLRASKKMESSLLSRIAQNMEISLKERPATVIVRQDVDDNAIMHIEICKSDNINRVVQKLKNDKFTDGPPTQSIFLREGDIIEVSFNPAGNIDFENAIPRRFPFNSNLSSSKLLTEIKEKDIFAQNASETYKGNVRVSLVERNYEPPPKFLPKSNQQNVDKKLIAELLLSLPKLPKDINKPNRIRFAMPNAGPLTEEYFQQLSEDLGPEWVIVADRLKFSKAAVERITATYADLKKSDATEKSIKHMLTDWFKTSSKSYDKVEDLRVALMEAGRNDLAEELAAKNKEYRQEMEKRTEEANLQKIIQAYCGSQPAVKAWKKVAKALGLNENDILAIQGEQTETVNREMVEGMLRRWKENRGRSANKDNLVVCLRNLKLTEAASKVGLVR